MQKPDLSAIWSRNRRLLKNCEETLDAFRASWGWRRLWKRPGLFKAKTQSSSPRGESSAQAFYHVDFLVLDDQCAVAGWDTAAKGRSLIFKTSQFRACFC